MVNPALLVMLFQFVNYAIQSRFKQMYVYLK